MQKSINKKSVVLLVCIIMLVATNSIMIVSSGDKDTMVDNFNAFISVGIQVLSAILIVVQLRDSRKAQQGEFIMNLNMSFVENDMYTHIYTELEKGDKAKLTRIEISDYLTFFESMFLLLQSGVINMKVLDDLFSYRFFLAAHNPIVQKEKLVDNPNNFRNIYHLEKMWMDYRKSLGLKIFREEDCLEVSCIKAGKRDLYDAIIKTKLK